MTGIGHREEVSYTGTTMDLMVLMAEGNPGALSALIELSKGELGLIDILHLDDMNVRGSQIWLGYKDHCDGDIEKFRTCIRQRDPEMVSTINANRGMPPEWMAVESGASSHGRRRGPRE